MNGIKLMIEEHKNIKRMLKVIRKACLNIINFNEINYDDFNNIIDFIRNYADKNHHGKEEKILFNRMVDEIGGAAEKLVKFGMLVEHDLGRLHIKQLEEALYKIKKGNKDARLDIIANSIAYADLLNRHIDKEDTIAYTFAERELCKDTLNLINKECYLFDEDMRLKGIQNKYISMIELLEHKYGLNNN